MATRLNYNFSHYKLREDIRKEELLNLISKLNQDDNVDGILVQMLIPRHLNARKIQNAISPLKDVDGLMDINMGKLVHGTDSLVYCTPADILDLLMAKKPKDLDFVIVGEEYKE